MIPALSEQTTVKCPQCGEHRFRLTASGLCGDCEGERLDREYRERAASALLERLPEEVDRRLEIAGLGKRERRAQRDRIPRVVFQGIPRDVAGAMREGKAPDRGFGLWGATGTGKTQAIACLAHAYVEGAIRDQAPKTGTVPDDVGLSWCSWLDEAAWLRTNGTESAAIARRVRRLSEVPVLVLDDLARERRRGIAGEDFAGGWLDVILDARSREMRPTIWTANVPPQTLVGIYGAALVSRLQGENPGTEVRGVDLRLQPSPEK